MVSHDWLQWHSHQGTECPSLTAKKKNCQKSGKQGKNWEKEKKKWKEKATIRKVLSFCPSWQIGLATLLIGWPNMVDWGTSRVTSLLTCYMVDHDRRKLCQTITNYHCQYSLPTIVNFWVIIVDHGLRKLCQTMVNYGLRKLRQTMIN